MKISYVCLIYKSVKWLKFVYEQFHKHTKLNEGDEFFFVANDACPEVLDYLKNNNINHYIHNNTEEQRKEWYINNVYRAWNKGGRMAKGDYVIFINSDMAFSKEWNINIIWCMIHITSLLHRPYFPYTPLLSSLYPPL